MHKSRKQDISAINEDSEPLLSNSNSMSSKPTEDPFYTIREYVLTLIQEFVDQLAVCYISFFTICSEVRSQADQVKVRHERFQDLVRSVDTSSNVEFKDLRKGIICVLVY